jgi:hypothetical protein
MNKITFGLLLCVGFIFMGCEDEKTFQLYATCGSPVCEEPDVNNSGLDPCTTQSAGDPCTNDGDDVCYVGCGISVLRCVSADPATMCPISRREYKEDITYLTPQELKKLSTSLEQFRLAKYKYKKDPKHQERLGFIIEDQEPNFSINSEKDRVDMYGYLSMAVASIQVQAREIENLKKEVRELKNGQTCSTKK